MRILLIDIASTTLEEIWPSVEHSLGLMYLSSALKHRFGDRFRLKIWTLISRPNRFHTEADAALRVLEDWQPDVVGIRSLTIGRDSLLGLIQTVNRWNENCFLVIGGPHATDQPEEVLRGGSVDCVVIGEGEQTFCDLMERHLHRDPIWDIPGIAFLREGVFMQTAPRDLMVDLDTIPFPDYSLIDLDVFNNRYQTFSGKISQRHGNILTTRGCPYRCMYCHNILGKKYRARSPENVLAEIRYLHDEQGITEIQVVDDIFNLDLDRAKKICDLIIESDLELILSFPNGVRGDRMDKELIDKLAAAGTRFMSYAIESGSPRIQRLINKNLDLDKVEKAIEHTARAGIITRGFFMLGFPTETEDEALQTVGFANRSALCGATFFTVVYFPGTELYRLAESLGYLQDGQYKANRDYVQTGEGAYEYSLETLNGIKLKAIREFAFTRNRIEGALRILPRYYTQREIDGFLMAFIVSSQLEYEDLTDPEVRRLLKRHFVIADRFSKKADYYV
ncbi:B12-binding domain-containing radical SAM protein [Gemmatimonadota bacterium]